MSKIPWTEKTWNPVVGCTKVSPGCDNCYAERMAFRLSCMGQEKYSAVVKYIPPGNADYCWNGNIVCDMKVLEIPRHWRNPRKIFVNSMSDTFHKKVDICFLTHLFDTIKQCPQHIFQILTKRPEQALKMMWGPHNGGWRYFGKGDYHPNIHLGTTCENQVMADLRIPYLLQTPAAVRFVSAEPLLGEINFDECIWHEILARYAAKIDQVIVGAESLGAHPGRHCDIEWVRNIVRQCKAAGVAVFVKQIHMWKASDKGTKNYYYETLLKAYEQSWPDRCLKRVLLKYPRDKDLFPIDLQCWEYPGEHRTSNTQLSTSNEKKEAAK